MRNSKDIDFTKVDFIVYATDEYLKDIPMFDIVSNYVRLQQISDSRWKADFEINDESFEVMVNTKTNECLLNSEPINAEQFVQLFEGDDVNPNPIIQRITGIDLDDYISEVTYAGGETEYLDIKGRKTLTGRWTRELNTKK